LYHFSYFIPFAPFVEEKYFDYRETVTSLSARFSVRGRINGIISTSGPKSVVAIVLSDIDFL